MTGDNVTCDDTTKICSMPGLGPQQNCQAYEEQFGNYNFKISFPGNENYLRIPLSTFVMQNPYLVDTCDVMVSVSPDEGTVFMGSMFFFQY